MVDRKDPGSAPAERDHLGARLHARPLLGEHEFAAQEVSSRRGQEKSGLQREDVLAVEILMQAVVVALAVLQKERRGLCLPGAMAAPEIARMILRIALGEAPPSIVTNV